MIRGLMECLLVIAFVSSQCASVKAQDCAKLANSSDDDLLQFLQQRAPGYDAACTILAIHALGEHRVVKAAVTLTKYLDFERPMTQPEKNGFFIHPWTIGRAYPAVSALSEIGMPALPSLLDIVRSNTDPNNRPRINAIRTIMTIYGGSGPSGVKFINDAAAGETDNTAAQSLRSAAAEAVERCMPEDKTRCKAAAGKTD